LLALGMFGIRRLILRKQRTQHLDSAASNAPGIIEPTVVIEPPNLHKWL
jgi:hypothetical protein